MNDTMTLNSNGFVAKLNHDEQDKPDLYQVELCKACLQHITPEMQNKGFSKQQSSYSYKNVVERTLGEYISNGAFIQAVIQCGLKYQIDAPNAFFAFRMHDFYEGLIKTKMQLFTSRMSLENEKFMDKVVQEAQDSTQGALKVPFANILLTLQMLLHNSQINQYDVLYVLQKHKVPIKFKFDEGFDGLDIGKSEVALSKKIIHDYLYR